MSTWFMNDPYYQIKPHLSPHHQNVPPGSEQWRQHSSNLHLVKEGGIDRDRKGLKIT